MHLVKMTMKWPSSMIGRGPKMFRYKIHWKLTFYKRTWTKDSKTSMRSRGFRKTSHVTDWSTWSRENHGCQMPSFYPAPNES